MRTLLPDYGNVIVICWKGNQWAVRHTKETTDTELAANTWGKQRSFIDKFICCMSKMNKRKHVTRNREWGSQREAFRLFLSPEMQMWGSYIKMGYDSYTSAYFKKLLFIDNLDTYHVYAKFWVLIKKQT